MQFSSLQTVLVPFFPKVWLQLYKYDYVKGRLKIRIED